MNTHASDTPGGANDETTRNPHGATGTDTTRGTTASREQPSKDKSTTRRRRPIVSKSRESLLDDGLAVVKTVELNLATLEALDGRKVPRLVGPGALRRWQDDAAAAARAIADGHLAAAAVRQSLISEVRARRILADDVAAIRGDVRLRLADRPDLAAALGFARAVDSRYTFKLLAAADLVLAAMEASPDEERLAAAGVTKARLADLATHRAALAGANGAHTEARANRRSAERAKRVALGKLKANTSAIRRIVGTLARNRPDLRDQFRTALHRHLPTPRMVKARLVAAAPAKVAA